jgi:hypothetical protein
MKPSRTVIVLAVVATASGCSGGHSTAPRQSLKQNRAFIARAERSCARAKTQLDALPSFPFRHFDPLHPDPRLLPKIGHFFTGPGNELPIVRRLYTQLRALGTPPANRAAWSEVIATYREYIAVFEQEDTAALAADTQAWVKAVKENRQAHTRLANATATFGTRRCDVL